MNINATFKCHKHPKYTAMKKPRTKCKACRMLFQMNTYLQPGIVEFRDSLLVWEPVKSETVACKNS